MSHTGHYRLALHPDADMPRFEDHMKTVIGVLQLTRVTSSFQSSLLRVSASPGDPAHPGQQYVCQVAVQTVNDAPYNFNQNAERVQAHVAEYATLISIESFVNIWAQSDADE
jgi:hypothetical protein